MPTEIYNALVLDAVACAARKLSGPDSTHETDATPPTTGKKGKAKKTKPATPSAPSSAPVAVTVPPQEPKLGLIAVLRGDFADSLPVLRGYSSPARISSALEAADTLVDVLAADAMAVPVDLVLSTTMRALKGIETVFLGLVARYGPPSSLNSPGADLTSLGLLSGARAASASRCDPASVLEALLNSVCTLVSTVLSALFVQRATKAKEATKKKIGIARARAAHAASLSSTAAIDDVLSGLYAHLLGPALHAFSALSEGYLTTSLAGTFDTTATGDEPTNLPDLRPDVFVLLGHVLKSLEDTFSGNEPSSIFASSPAAPSATVPAAPNAAVPVLDDVRTILALECVRELGKLYLPPDPARLRGRTDESASPNAAALSPAALVSASSSTSASRARPGTASGSALSSVGVGAGVPLSANVGRGAPRAPRNLGETYSGTSSGPGRGPVVRAGAASADIAKRKRQRRETGTDATDLGARIAKLAKKDTAWWLCAVLDRLLPSLPAPLSASTSASASPQASQLEAISLASASGDRAAPTPTVRCADVAYEAVYDALADLLRRTRPRSRIEHFPPAAAAAQAHPSSPSLRGLSSTASNHARAGSSRTSGPRRVLSSAEEGLAEMELESAAVDVLVDMPIGGGSAGNEKRAGQGGAEMGEVERGLLLAVLERAWLGV
ncbi:hypothetical protein GY45DRAFT_1347433 [Cubamyces sp. BRFM 1775]|nr:hypothetical protein GY45DRAFT_1347433 [Cubamyces sp. BRFM 1775]